MKAPPGFNAAEVQFATKKPLGNPGVWPFQPAWPVRTQTPLGEPFATLYTRPLEGFDHRPIAGDGIDHHDVGAVIVRVGLRLDVVPDVHRQRRRVRQEKSGEATVSQTNAVSEDDDMWAFVPLAPLPVMRLNVPESVVQPSRSVLEAVRHGRHEGEVALRVDAS